jgi:epoxyqueuosine reductase
LFPEKENITLVIREEALKIGFDEIGFTTASELSADRIRLKEWLNNNFHAGMSYMANHFEKRLNPNLLEENGKSVISVLKSYHPENDRLSTQSPKIARYAYGKDYHAVMKEKMAKLFSFIKKTFYPDLKGRCFVDSAPLLERSLAVRAGLGWIGKNGMLINRRLGSYVFIGELVIDIDLTYNNIEEKNRCGNCSKCTEACPTKAIIGNSTVDSNKCISYLTIENKGEIPEKYKNKLSGWIFGCDICQEVCPWNRIAKPMNEPEFKSDKYLLEMSPNDWKNISNEKFNELFRNSAIKRTKFEGLKRNIDLSWK